MLVGGERRVHRPEQFGRIGRVLGRPAFGAALARLRRLREAGLAGDGCAGERMEALYTHLGFEKHAQAAVDDPTNQTKKLAMVSMVRLPRSAAPAAQ